MLHAVIMAGGSGTRFWPQSRKARPKQFLTLRGDRSMIQSTVDRCQPWIPLDRTWIVTLAEQAEMTARQVPDIPAAQILQEPAARNTAPCLGLAAVHLLARDPEAVMLVMPADHDIGPPEVFHHAVERAAQFVADDPARLMLFGVPPSYPSIAFGYIEQGDPLDDAGDAFTVASFREKPDVDVAQRYVDSGTFLWNCGIFVWRADRILELINEYEPTIGKALESLRDHIGSDDLPSRIAEVYPTMNKISIDNAVLERAANIGVVRAPYDWDDVGSWQALSRLLGTDEQGNTIDGPHVGIDTTGCIVRSTDDHIVATLGIDDCIIVHTPDATLVANKHDENAVKELVNLLRERGHDAFL